MEEIITLVHRAQIGDAAAYGVLVGRFQDMAYGYAYTLLNDYHLSQDAAQEAFIEAYLCLPGLREALAFPSWLKRKVHKHCDRLMRSKRPQSASLEAASALSSPLPGPADLAEQRELARSVRSAICALPQGQREVTMLFYIGGYSHQEIADFLDVPSRTVKSRLHAARSRLRERMMEMVENELKANALPGTFTQEIVDEAVARAGALRQDQHYDEAEALLREVLGQIPEHVGALRELNRTLMHGRVYGQARWDLLSELVAHGRAILQVTEDDQARQQLIVTLLAIPVMPEAASLLEEWIAKRGPSLERLGMLAWAKGCMGDGAAAELLWGSLLQQAGRSTPEEVLDRVPFVAYTLVDCFAASGEIARAQRIAQRAWELCEGIGPIPLRPRFPDDEVGWLMLFRQARLDTAEIAGTLLATVTGDVDPEREATALSLRNWIEEADVMIPICLEWVRGRIAADAFDTIERFRAKGLQGFRARGNWQAADRLALGIWELLGQSASPEAVRHRTYWSWELDNPAGAIEAEDWTAAEEIVRRNLARFGVEAGSWWATMLAARRGLPSPPDVVEAVGRDGVVDIDAYGLWGWYLVAREAGAAGDTTRAFDALRTALSYWSNPPYALLDVCERDTYWGALRADPEFERIVAEKRARLGPVRGQLHYFPGW